MTGRSDEMGVLIRLLGGVADAAGVVIAGQAGVGKTRLAHEAAVAAAKQGWVVRSVQGTSAAQAIPLGAFSQWLDAINDQPLALVGSVIASVTASQQGAPVLVVADDVHLLDDLSAFALHQLVRRGAARVIATLRTDELTPVTITELWKDGHLKRLDLKPLAREECSALLEVALDGPIDVQSARRLWDLTRGNVLFMHELVLQEREAERLIKSDGQWVWTGSVSFSPVLADLVDVHIGRAPEPVLDLLDLVAVAEPLEIGYLLSLADSETIEDAERRDLIRVTHEPPTDLVRIAHPLYAESRRAHMGRMRARRLRGRVVEAMRSPMPGAGIPDPVRLALLWLESDLPGEPEVHYRGAAEAYRRLDVALSERLAQAAITANAGVESRILHARCVSMRGDGDGAEKLLAALPVPDAFDDAWVSAQTLRALNLLLTQGQPDRSWNVIEKAISDAPPELDNELLAFRALQLAMAAHPLEVVALCDSIDYDQLSAISRINLNFGTTIALGDLGRLEQATKTPEDILVLAVVTRHVVDGVPA